MHRRQRRGRGLRYGLVLCWIFAGSVNGFAEESVSVEAITPPSGNSVLGSFYERVYQAIEREARYRALDGTLLTGTPEHYLKELQRAEMNALLDAVYRYARYQNTVPNRVQNHRAIVRFPDTLSWTPGLSAKHRDLETTLQQELYVAGDQISTARDVFEWRQSLWLARLSNYSAALSRLDRQSEEADETKQAYLSHLRDQLLGEEPLLARKVTSPVNPRDMRPLYSYLADIYHRIPAEDLLCRGCPILEMIGWTPAHLDSVRRQLQQQRTWLERFAGKALQTLLDPVTDPVPVSSYEAVLELIPGGIERFYDLTERVQQQSDDERLERRVRDELALQFVLPALEECIQVLMEGLVAIRDRTFADYVAQPHFRQAVIASVPPEYRTSLALIDARMLERHKKERRYRRVGEIAYYVGLGASFLISPAGKLKTALWVSRALVSGAHGIWAVAEARRTLSVSRTRVLAQLVSYDRLALAHGQFRTAIVYGLLEVFTVIRYGPLIHRVEKSLARALLGILQNPGASSQILRITFRNGAKPIMAFFRTLANGKTLLRRIGSELLQANRQIAAVGRAAFRMRFTGEQGAIRLLKNSVLSHALYNAGTSGTIVIGAEWANRGSDFLHQPGFWRNLVIIVLDDGALAFFGLGRFNAVERLITIGGNTFASSIIGQLLTGVRDPGELAKRASFDSMYVLTFALWRVQLAERFTRGVARNQARLPLLRLMDPAKFEVGARTVIFTANNALGNYLYSLSTINFFEGAPPTTTPWWPEMDEEESADEPPVPMAETPIWWQRKTYATGTHEPFGAAAIAR